MLPPYLSRTLDNSYKGGNMEVPHPTQYCRMAMIMALLATTMSVALATPTEASAAVSNCEWSCSYYMTRTETRHMAELANYLRGQQLCDAILRYDESGTQSACYQMAMGPTTSTAKNFRATLQRAAQSNSCVKFHAPVTRWGGGLFVKTATPYQGQYCQP